MEVIGAPERRPPRDGRTSRSTLALSRSRHPGGGRVASTHAPGYLHARGHANICLAKV